MNAPDNQYACQITIADLYDAPTKLKRGSKTYMSNVEVARCGPEPLGVGAINFKFSSLGEALIKNCSIYNGPLYGLKIDFSGNITFQ